MKVPFMLAVAAVLWARPARADQCEWLDDPSIARRAARELASHPELIEFCEPCGDEAPGMPRRANRVAVRTLRDHTEVAIDGETVDLAYVYLKTSQRQYRNLAMLAGCAVTGVSSSLRIDAATTTSVVIRADHGALAVAPVPVPPATAHAPAAPAPAAPAPMILVVEPSSDSIWRWLALLASLGALVAWRMARRRLPHVPRATNL